MHYVYILKSEIKTEKLYIGVTSDLARRLDEHNQGLSTYSSKFKPWEIVSCIGFKYRYSAEIFEQYLKQGSGFAFMKKHLLPKI